MIKGPFNTMASDYDDVFTNTEIGRLQREKVWDYIDSQFDFNQEINVLELNCGTGEDAVHFARRGCKVMATDISPEMLKIAKEKAEKAGVADRIQFQILNVENISANDLNHQYDLVFSNFGGLNCVPISVIRTLQSALWNGLRSKGRFIAVVMPKGCMMETIYFCLKLQFGKAFRRGKTVVDWVNDAGETHSIYYHSPRRFVDQFGRRFKTKVLLPIGLWVPPSYMEPFFKKRSGLLNFLSALEQRSLHPITAGISDHYLIDLKIKN